MRFLSTVIGGAIFLFLLYIGVGGIVDGYFGGDIVPDRAVPDSWSAPDSWSEWRDIFFVLTGFFWVLAALFFAVLMVVLVFLAITVRKLVKDNLSPAIDSLRDSLDNVRGTTEFAGESVVSPLIRVYSVYRGVRSGFGAVGGIGSRIRGNKDGKKRR
ncbi:MAG: hypothetical protein ACSLFM_12780 [Tepidiformaceae bacterium]